uniref:Uncharacterized protein n=1 Tax=Arundo donax TaxID=35708 RepID=A0A0A9HNJ8_ARUDO
MSVLPWLGKTAALGRKEEEVKVVAEKGEDDPPVAVSTSGT